MIIKVDIHASEENIKHIHNRISELNCVSEVMHGTHHDVIAVLGDTGKIDTGVFEVLDGVVNVQRIQAPYKRVSRQFQPEDSIVQVGDVAIGGDNMIVMAGPCSVEFEEQLFNTAKYSKEAGAHILRGGIVKPRTSPYAFQGLGEEGLQLMEKARERYAMPIVCELMSIEQVKTFGPRLDMIQIGARNMQNFDLLKACGEINVPILLKRGLSSTIEEWLMSAEYIMAHGNKNIVLCERGIRTFESAYRNVTDLNAVPMIRKLTHLPIIVDPSHATGKDWMVKDLALASVACGAHGVMLETHFNPEIALSDGPQSLDEDQYREIMKPLLKLSEFMKTMNEE